MGPIRFTSQSSFKYYIIMIDYFSIVSWVFLLKDQFEVSCTLKSFIIEIKTQFGIIVKNMCTDDTLEFKSGHLLSVTKCY